MRDTYYESLIVDYGTEKVLATRTDMGTSTAMRWIQQQLAELDGNLAAICHEWVYNDLVGEHVIHRTAHGYNPDGTFNFEPVTA
jgi:hypothetical protein